MNAKLAKAVYLFIGLATLSAIHAVGQVQTSTSIATSLTASPGYICVQRGPDSKVWQQAVMLTNADGDVSTNYQSYTELATGLSYLNNNGQLVDSVEEVDAIPGGAQAIQGPHKVNWNLNANTPGGAVTITTPDGKQLSSTVFGLAYYDVASGSNAPVAYLQNCTGTISPPNQVVYANAFSNLNADLYYTYTKAGLSQDVVLRQAPAAPDAYGLSDETTILQIYTEFFNSPEPEATALTNGNVIDDVFLDFGGMTMTVGDTLFFDSQGDAITTGAVSKQWTHVNNRTFLIESVPFSSISNQIAQLHHASILKPGRGSVRGLALLHTAPSLLKPDARDKAAMQVAKNTLGRSGLSIDYNLTGTSSNLTLQGDTTYLVSSAVSVTNILTIEGGAVIKYGSSGQINVTGPGSNIVCQTGPYRPAVFTSVYDGSVGASISNGTPVVTANTYLNFQLAGTQPLTLRYLRFSYASTAIAGAITIVGGASDWIKIWDCQFFDCATGFTSTPNEATSLYLYNVLFSAVTYGVSTGTSNGSMTIGAANVTGDAMNSFAYNINGAKLSATNCLFTAVTNMPWLSLWTDCQSNLNGLGVYQPTGAAGYYLTNGVGTKGASVKNSGTTGIDAGLLADLQTLTTYPPVILPTYITASTNLSQTALRNNTGNPDLGYHYSPIDYAVNCAITNAAVEVEPGVVLAGYGTVGLQLRGTSTAFNCTGTATAPVWITRYNTVQEQSNTNWQVSPASWTGCLQVADDASLLTPTVAFTDWSVLGGDTLISDGSAGNPCVLTLQNCQLYSGNITLFGQTLVSTNCLYQRTSNSLTEAGTESDANTFYNNLFLDGSLTIKHSGAGIWTFRDNLFDQAIITTNSGKLIDFCSNNAYATNLTAPSLTPLQPTNNDVFLTSSPSYRTGGFGQFYYPVTQTTLIKKGSQSAAAAGLTNFTTCINNVADGANTVSIGYHFPSQPPMITSEPVNIATNVGGAATFSVTATGMAPLTYQWYQNGVPLAGDTGSSLTFYPVVASNAGNYTVIVTDPLGSTASYFVTLKAAQNDFFVNYFSSSPISPMSRGLDGLFLGSTQDFNLITGAARGASLRGVAIGTDANTHNWMTLHSWVNDATFFHSNGGYAPGAGGPNSGVVIPTTTLQFLEDACLSGATPIITVNCIGTGTNIYPSTGGYVCYVTNSSPSSLEQMASDWVIYANLIVPNCCWSNGIIVGITNTSVTNFMSTTNQYYSNFTNIMGILTNSWVLSGVTNILTTNLAANLPTLLSSTMLTNTNFFSMPKVKYWEIGNEVDGIAGTSNVFSNSLVFTYTAFAATNYDLIYKALRTVMTNVDSTIKIGPGFGGSFGNDPMNYPFLSDPSVQLDFSVYHPYPFSIDGYWTDNSTNGLEGSLESIRFWQDLNRNSMYRWFSQTQRPINVPLLATEWSGDAQTSLVETFGLSMWAMLADTETLLSQVKGQQTLAADYYYDHGSVASGSCWPQLFGQFQTNLGNWFLSSDDGDVSMAFFDDPLGTNLFLGSSDSPFRVYSTLNSSNNSVSVWMLNFSNSASLTVDLHLPGVVSSAELYTLECPTNASGPSFYSLGSNGGPGAFVWSNSSLSLSGANLSTVMTIPQATVSVAQFWLSTVLSQPAVPVITAIPWQGQPGQTITITGNNFSPNAQQNIVYFGPVRGTVTGANANQINVQVPYGAAYGPVTVTVSNLTASSTTYFNPAYYGANVTNPIVMQAVLTNRLANQVEGNNLALVDMGLMDINGDGKPDLMFMGGDAGIPFSTTLGSAALYLNSSSGTGNFSFVTNKPFAQPANYNPGFMAFGDFDGDGLPDWAWVDLNDIIVSGNTSTPQGAACSRFNQYMAGRGSYGIKAADFDGDGKLDIVVANETDGTVSIFRNVSSGTGNLTFAQKVDFPACTNAAFLAVGDFNGDGRPDIAVVGYTNAGTPMALVILTNACTPGTLNFSNQITITNLVKPLGIAVGDFNMDGKLDIVVSSSGGTFPGVYVYTNSSSVGSVSFEQADYKNETAPYGISIGDLNGDGLPDIALANPGNNAVSVFRNTGNGTFATAVDYPLPSGAGPICVAAGDLDGDGHPDLAVGNYGTTNVVIFQNISQY